MTREENEIMRDAFFFLRDHNDPPGNRVPGCDAFWERAAGEALALGQKWDNHPLALEVLPAIYSYLGDKALQKDGDTA